MKYPKKTNIPWVELYKKNIKPSHVAVGDVIKLTDPQEPSPIRYKVVSKHTTGVEVHRES